MSAPRRASARPPSADAASPPVGHDPVAYAVLTLAVATYAPAAVAAKIAVRWLPPLTAACLRFVLAAALLALLVAALRRWRGPWPAPRDWPLFALLGASGVAVFNVSYFAGLQLTTASEGALIAGSNPLFTLVLAGLVLGERISPAGALGALVSLGGIALVVFGAGATSEGPNRLLGDAILFVSALGWAVYTLAARVAARRYSALMITFASAIVGASLMLAPALWQLRDWEGGSLPLEFWHAMIYLAWGTSPFGFVGWIFGVRRIGASRAAVFGNLSPIMAVTFAALTLGERLTAAQLLGVGLILAGLWLVNRPSRACSRPDTPETGGDAGRRRRAPARW